ncbi:hypothetical protein CANTEDRAFT_112329 [Yamadazyma tenuis ATCC 10573]|nr:uncharacterized protein CANTEDRAFT_112329 [Yamadazyma tenuis ATCC 10573]EGV66617.1 hypothetical protein CANTEDRAFT_112329 [Yamadazyma tenuis ATCC 10573]
MDWGSNLLHQIGGLGSFNKSKEEIWLISNFAYHDVLSSNKADRGLYFSGEQYDRIFSHDLSNGIMHPLVGIAKDIYICIGMISTLVFETNQKLMTLNNELNEKNVSDSPKTEVGIGTSDINKFEEESDLSNHAKVNEILLSVKASAMELDAKIEAAKPNSEDLINLTDQEFEWQITLFETFKLSAKLYLRQAILRCNPSSLESQILTNDLVKCLDIILGSPVQTVLSFPVFMAGIHCVTVLDRQFMTARIEQYIRTYGPWSLTRVRAVIEKIWEFNPKGDTVVDWHGVLKEFGWEINFA